MEFALPVTITQRDNNLINFRSVYPLLIGCEIKKWIRRLFCFNYNFRYEEDHEYGLQVLPNWVVVQKK